MTFYNDNEPYVQEWLKNLIAGGHTSAGDVNGESIRDIEAWQLAGYKRCHFFAGIGGWDYALRLAGWPVEREVWTGSCPCQPFSVAGKRKGTSDERHLWPEFYRLISEWRPSTIFGEQVASKDGREWLAGVFTDLEALGYAVAGADLCTAGVGAPHIRQRLYWVAYAERDSRDAGRLADESREGTGETATRARLELGRCGNAGGLGDDDAGLERWSIDRRLSQPSLRAFTRETVIDASAFNGLDNGESEQMGRTRFAWENSAYIPCLDGKTRRIEPGLQPLAHGIPARVGKLRAYGNAIVPQVAAEFIRACLQII